MRRDENELHVRVPKAESQRLISSIICLDEWDVFLFQLDRKATSEELLRFCLRNPDKQFIFIFISLQVNEISFQRNMT